MSRHETHRAHPAPSCRTTRELSLLWTDGNPPWELFSINYFIFSLSLLALTPSCACTHTHGASFRMVSKHVHVFYCLKASHLHLLKLTPNYFFSHSQLNFLKVSSICTISVSSSPSFLRSNLSSFMCPFTSQINTYESLMILMLLKAGNIFQTSHQRSAPRITLSLLTPYPSFGFQHSGFLCTSRVLATTPAAQIPLLAHFSSRRFCIRVP